MESILLEKAGGQAAVLVPGGAPEALNCDKGEVGREGLQYRFTLKLSNVFVQIASCICPNCQNNMFLNCDKGKVGREGLH